MPDEYDIPEGYAPGTRGSSTDTETGVTRSWSEPPHPRYVPPQQQFEINPDAVIELLKNQKADEAAKRIAAAQAFLAQRGYEKDITEAALQSDPIKQAALRHAAAVKWIPIMVGPSRQSGAAMMRALTPPAMTPYQEAQNKLARERFEYGKTNRPPTTLHQQEQEKLAREKFEFARTNQPVTEIIKAVPGEDAIPAVKGPPFGRGWWGNKPAQPAVPGTPERRIRKNLPREEVVSAPAPVAAPAPAAAPAAAVETFPSTDDARKAGKKAGDVIYLKGVGKVRLK